MAAREHERSVALDLAKQDIARRLRRVCENFEEAEFMKLVDRIAEIDMRYRLRDEWGYFRALQRAGLN